MPYNYAFIIKEIKKLLLYLLFSLGNRTHWPWLSRIDYFENNRQNLSSHLEFAILTILENNQIFACYLSKWQAKITSSEWQEENKMLLFSISGIEDQGHSKVIFIADQSPCCNDNIRPKLFYNSI